MKKTIVLGAALEDFPTIFRVTMKSIRGARSGTVTIERVFETVVERGAQFRNAAKGYGLGSGDCIPEYIPVDGYLAMVDAVKEIRKRDTATS